MLVPAVLIVAAFVAAEGAATRDGYPHVRMPQARVARLVAGAVTRSPTFASLIRQLQRTDVVVFVATSTALAPRMTGRTMLVNTTSTVRYLQADVRADAPEHDIIVTIAHELQHALEIAASGVRNERELTALFESIGERHARGFESEGALAVGAQVRKELSQRPSKLIAERSPKPGTRSSTELTNP